MSRPEQFLSHRKRSHPLAFPHEVSDEERAREWTLAEEDCTEVGKYRKRSRLYLAAQRCAVRLSGRFIPHGEDVSPRIITHVGSQLNLPPSLPLHVPDREGTYLKHRRTILTDLGFQRFDEAAHTPRTTWLAEQPSRGLLPDELFQQAEQSLVTRRILLPGPSVLERLSIHVAAEGQAHLFPALSERRSLDWRRALDQVLAVPEGEQRSSFYQRNEYPSAAPLSSLHTSLKRYQAGVETGIAEVEAQRVDPALLDDLFKLAKRSNATDLKRVADPKRYALMLGFLLETRQILRDHLVQMPDP